MVSRMARRKNRNAVELGRRGGLKGGKARAAALTRNRRVEIATKASAAALLKLRERQELRRSAEKSEVAANP